MAAGAGKKDDFDSKTTGPYGKKDDFDSKEAGSKATTGGRTVDTGKMNK